MPAAGGKRKASSSMSPQNIATLNFAPELTFSVQTSQEDPKQAELLEIRLQGPQLHEV